MLLQARDLEFHSHSFDQIIEFVTEGGGTCGIEISPGVNTTPVVSAGSTDFTLPHSTPFMLRGSATDSEGADMLSDRPRRTGPKTRIMLERATFAAAKR